MLSTEQLQAIGRHLISYSAGAITVFMGFASIAYSFHVVSLDQVNSLSAALKAFGQGLTTMVGAVGTVASILATAWGAYAASKSAQAASVAQVPGTTIVTSPELAKQVPAANVVSNHENKVVLK